MKKFGDVNEYIRWLEDELNKIRGAFVALAQSVSVERQCTIQWNWDKPVITPQGDIIHVKLEALIKLAIASNYRIISVVVTEHDETGSPLHAIIIALYPKDGRLH